MGCASLFQFSERSGASEDQPAVIGILAISRADDLLQLAEELSKLRAPNHRQVDLSRAVSTAYYSLFHLLISEATLNWREEGLRPILGRIFEHGKMKSACDAKISELNFYFEGNPSRGREQVVSIHLHWVATTFVQSQQQRNDADYNTAKEWTDTEVATLIASVAQAFKSWRIIHEEIVAQALLVSMLGGKERKEALAATGKKKKRKNPIPPIPTNESLPPP
jgi:uncharacterized protein (UPF0332 family)